jgi:hypothetical protein
MIISPDVGGVAARNWPNDLNAPLTHRRQTPREGGEISK